MNEVHADLERPMSIDHRSWLWSEKTLHTSGDDELIHIFGGGEVAGSFLFTHSF